MGTSGSFGGPAGDTPLVPTWLEPEQSLDAPAVDDDQSIDAPDAPPADSASPPAPPYRPVPTPADDVERFRGARSSLTRFARSGGRTSSQLSRAVSRYVSTASGGPRQAARRMGASRVAGGRLLSFLADAQARGARAALAALNLEQLAGRPVDEIFLGLAGYVSPNSATVDEGIARNAFVETIVDLAAAGITNLDGLTAEQVQTVFEIFAAHAIEGRICNDIGGKIIALPANLADAQRVQRQLRDYIRGAVRDALTTARQEFSALTPDRVVGFVTDIYEKTFRILQSLGDTEAT